MTQPSNPLSDPGVVEAYDELVTATHDLFVAISETDYDDLFTAGGDFFLAALGLGGCIFEVAAGIIG